MSSEKLQAIVSEVQEYVDMNESAIQDFIDGGDEGWDCGDEEQQDWLNSTSVSEIANWVIAGNS